MSDHVALDEITWPQLPTPDLKHLNDGRAALHPRCVACSARQTLACKIPMSMVVERVTISREHPGRGYMANVHCHGDDELILLGENTPTDREIQNLKAFDGTPSPILSLKLRSAGAPARK